MLAGNGEKVGVPQSNGAFREAIAIQPSIQGCPRLLPVVGGQIREGVAEGTGYLEVHDLVHAGETIVKGADLQAGDFQAHLPQQPVQFCTIQLVGDRFGQR